MSYLIIFSFRHVPFFQKAVASAVFKRECHLIVECLLSYHMLKRMEYCIQYLSWLSTFRPVGNNVLSDRAWSWIPIQTHGTVGHVSDFQVARGRKRYWDRQKNRRGSETDKQKTYTKGVRIWIQVNAQVTPWSLRGALAAFPCRANRDRA